MRAASTALVVLLSCATDAIAQSAPPAVQVTAPAPAAATGQPPATWAFSAAVYSYLLPGEGNYAQPTLTADRAALHLEVRYNYEALSTGSLWVGCNFAGGERLTWELTPMLGGVFGDTVGIAPGYKGSLGWKALAFSSEGEYVVDADDSAESFFYNWSELSVAPVEWLRAGLVTQRTRVYHTDREIQRGLLVGVTHGPFDLTTYVFNPDDEKPTVVIAVAVSF